MDWFLVWIGGILIFGIALFISMALAIGVITAIQRFTINEIKKPYKERELESAQSYLQVKEDNLRDIF